MHALHAFLLLHVLTFLGQNGRGSDIINGEKAAEGSLLYMASVQTSKNQHVCGGFLISEDFVVTAAHCDSPDVTHVILGTHNLKKANEAKKRSIKERHRHPYYRDVGYGSDIMLLKMEKKVKLDNRVRTIPFPSSDAKMRDGTQCRVAGWGFTRSCGGAADELRVVNVSIINPQVCLKEWEGLPALPIICAGGYNTTKGFCQGDSGGPLVCNGKAIGVVSFNHCGNCNYPNKPNVYTDISKYVTWIRGILDNP